MTTGIRLPADCAEQFYAGVLDTLIGVYFGRPAEGWSYERIKETHGELDGRPMVDIVDDAEPLPAGSVALIVTEGTLASGPVRIEPLTLRSSASRLPTKS